MKKILLCIVILLFLSGCADIVSCEQIVDPVGFWHGLWHGLIIGPAFLVSLFCDNVAIYATYNNGNWYNFGFVLGFGSLISGSRSTKK